MNPEKQRIAIAEARGMIGPFENSEEWFENGDSDGCIIVLRDAIGKRVANYLNDLNAMREAEKTLDASQCAEYARQLMKHHPTYCVTVLDNRFAPTEEIAYETYQLLHATAAQRAEAFLRTIGKWEDDK